MPRLFNLEAFGGKKKQDDEGPDYISLGQGQTSVRYFHRGVPLGMTFHANSLAEDAS
eukprot:m.247871 g.247871  ORF g.247871 m.247871 type:complete len:57 (+) comp15865_c1_seq1:243-413(+)